MTTEGWSPLGFAVGAKFGHAAYYNYANKSSYNWKRRLTWGFECLDYCEIIPTLAKAKAVARGLLKRKRRPKEVVVVSVEGRTGYIGKRTAGILWSSSNDVVGRLASLASRGESP